MDKIKVSGINFPAFSTELPQGLLLTHHNSKHFFFIQLDISDWVDFFGFNRIFGLFGLGWIFLDYLGFFGFNRIFLTELDFWIQLNFLDWVGFFGLALDCLDWLGLALDWLGFFGLGWIF